MAFGTPEYAESDWDWMARYDANERRAERAEMVRKASRHMPTVARTLKALRERKVTT